MPPSTPHYAARRVYESRRLSMPGRGPAPKPKAERRNFSAPIRGEWQPTEAVGWQHGAVPSPPDGIMPASIEAWETWFGAWWASHWSPEDLPGLRTVIRLYDEVERGEFQRATELRIQMDNYGITPKGQQDRRWARPTEEKKAASVQSITPRRLTG